MLNGILINPVMFSLVFNDNICIKYSLAEIIAIEDGFFYSRISKYLVSLFVVMRLTLNSLFSVSGKLILLETLDKTNFNLSGSQCCVDDIYQKFFEKDPHEMTEVC